MANPNFYVYTVAGARTVEAKGDIVDRVFRISPEDTQLLSRLSRRKVQDPNPRKQEDDLKAIDLTNARAEGAAAVAAVSQARTTRSNWCQILTKTAEVSNVQNATAQYGIAKELDYQMMLAAKELARDAEAILISDQAVQAPTNANGRIGKMASIGALITTNTNLVVNFSQANFELLVRAAFITHGGNPTDVWCDATRKAAINAWTSHMTRYIEDARKIYNEVQVFESDYGPALKIHMHKHMPQNIAGNGPVLFCLDMGGETNWEILEHIPFHSEEYAYTGGAHKKGLEWTFCALPAVEKSNFAFVG